ncbi:hypothetical protein GCM10020331_079530 [Ectobacillus funiculus]
MHGLVLLDEEHQVLRNTILWNDTRTTEQCRQINEIVGTDRLLEITKKSSSRRIHFAKATMGKAI